MAIGEASISLDAFNQAFVLAQYIQVDEETRILVLGLDKDEDRWEFLLLRQDSGEINWGVKDYYRVYDQLKLDHKRLHWDANNQWLYLTVEQEWSSEGDLQRYLFLRPTEQGWQVCTDIYSSGGQELAISSNKLSTKTSFYSSINYLGVDVVELTYYYQLWLHSTCDIVPFEDTLLQDSTIMRYYLSTEEDAFLPDWSSLQNLTKTQFVALTDWTDLEGFKEQWQNWVMIHQGTHPKTVQAVEQAFLK